MKKTKKPYVKPEVVKVDLVAEEAVLGGCKNNVQTLCGPEGFSCTAVPGS